MVAVLIGLGVYMIHGIADVELRKSTYTRTLFDYHIAAPDKAQVQAIEAEPSVTRVFPYYAYAKAFSQNDDVMLLISDDMDDHDASLLTEATLIEGSYDKNGAMLDKTAADALGVSVGDNISFSLMGQRFSRTVAAIYLPSALAILEEGIVLVDYSADIARVSAPAAYGGAFVVASDRHAAATLLSNYAGEGNITLTYAQYVDLYCGDILPGQTQEAYEATCAEKYAAYREEVLASAKKDGGQVVDKMEAYALLKEQILTTEKKQGDMKILTAVAAFAVFATVSILFIVTNAANDRIRRDMGLRAGKLYLSCVLSTSVAAVVASAVVGIVLYMVAKGTYFPSECIGVVLSVSLPVLAALVSVLLAAFVYVKLLYNNSASKD